MDIMLYVCAYVHMCIFCWLHPFYAVVTGASDGIGKEYAIQARTVLFYDIKLL